MSFMDKKVLVTGAASGIGRATAIRFSQEGAQVIMADINKAGLDETASMIERPSQIEYYDAADYQSCENMVARAAANGLDVLCNISGILKWGSSLSFNMDDFDQVLKINAASVFAICKYAMPHLIKSGGNIVNTSSIAGVQGMAYNIAYSASKHAVLAITKGLAIEFAAAGVRVNAICPGYVKTDMAAQMTNPPEGVDMSLIIKNTPKLEDGACEPEDIAEMFAFLAGEGAQKITGSVFTIDGGQLAG